MSLGPEAIRYLTLIEKERTLVKKRACVEEMLTEFRQARDMATCKMAEFAAQSVITGLAGSLAEIDRDLAMINEETTRGTA